MWCCLFYVEEGLKNMKISENVELLKMLFMNPQVVPGVSRLQLFSIIKHYGMNHLYVGYRINHFIDSPRFEEERKERSGHTLLFHDSGDMFYYDILDENTICIRQKEGITIASHVVKDVEGLEDCLPKVKKVGGIK